MANMKTSHAFVRLEPGMPVFNVTTSNPPVTGGVVVDTFEHDEGLSAAQVLEIARARNLPFSMVYPDGQVGEAFDNLDEALSLAWSRARAQAFGHKLVTSQGVAIKVWEKA